MAKKEEKTNTEEAVLDNTSDIEEISFSEEDLDNSGLRDLLEKGREKGFLTYEEINLMLPDDISDPDQLEDTIQKLINVGIEVHETDALAGSDDSAAPETVSETRTTLTSVEAEVGRTTDPVRLYMREMGTVDLLTREGEIAIAKRIEEGSRELLSACCFYPGIVEKIIEDYDAVIAEDKRLTEVIVGFMDIEDEIPPPAIIQKKLKDKGKQNHNDDEEEVSGPDPVEVKKRFRALKTQFKKTEKACLRSRTTKIAIKEQEKLGEIFKFFKLSPTQFELISLPAREALSIIREVEKEMLFTFVKKAKMPRKDFIKGFVGNETDQEWAKKTSRKKETWAKVIKSELEEILRLQNKLINLERIIGLEISSIKEINRKMSIGQAKIRRAK